jgi:Kef-type K+ transport system membrane component KefB/mannitol/fructose-specific phosphotransferase system IIA component
MPPTLLLLAIVLLAGMAAGAFAARWNLPRVTGWILAGVLLRQLKFPGAHPEVMAGFLPINDFVLGYIAFLVGSHLNLRRLRNAGSRLAFIMVTEALITPTIVTLSLVYLGGLPLRTALFLAAIAVAQAPGTTIAVANEVRSRGVFTKTLVASVALIDMVAVVLFETVHAEYTSGLNVNPLNLLASLPSSFLVVLGESAMIGLLCAVFVIFFTRKVVEKSLLGTALIAAILLAWGLASALDVSPILATTALGMALTNFLPNKEEEGEAYVQSFQGILFTIFYTLAGLRLDFSLLPKVAGLVVIFFLARLGGKILSSFLAMTCAHATPEVRNYLGLALTPHGGVAVGLILLVQAEPALADIHEIVLAVGLTALAVNQILGPSITRAAITRAGEAGKDRPRLLDFLHEENIAVDLMATNKEEAISELVDLLISSHHLQGVSHENLMASVLKRESEMSTCVGEGLMIPHCAYAGTDSMLGVMALSREGFPWKGPDNRPIHCMVLLVTGDGQAERHLAVLAALARSIGSDPVLQHALYAAPTAAHAYVLLHAEDTESFNHFLEAESL